MRADVAGRSIKNPLQLSARLVIALFMVVIISSKVHTAAHCNYTCAAISALEKGGSWGFVGGEMWEVFEKKRIVHFMTF